MELKLFLIVNVEKLKNKINVIKKNKKEEIITITTMIIIVGTTITQMIVILQLLGIKMVLRIITLQQEVTQPEQQLVGQMVQTLLIEIETTRN